MADVNHETASFRRQKGTVFCKLGLFSAVYTGRIEAEPFHNTAWFTL